MKAHGLNPAPVCRDRLCCCGRLISSMRRPLALTEAAFGGSDLIIFISLLIHLPLPSYSLMLGPPDRKSKMDRILVKAPRMQQQLMELMVLIGSKA